MGNIEVLDFRDFCILISKMNGNTITIEKSFYSDEDLEVTKTFKEKSANQFNRC